MKITLELEGYEDEPANGVATAVGQAVFLALGEPVTVTVAGKKYAYAGKGSAVEVKPKQRAKPVKGKRIPQDSCS